MIWKYLKQLHRDFKASVAKTFRANEVVKVLSLAHNQELSQTPIESWPITKLRHQEQIKAVMAGRFDEIVDRRSWNFPFLPEALHRLNQPLLKSTAYNLIRFSETPIPRRAINIIKNSILSLKWEIRPTKEADADNPNMEMRINIATHTLKHPNNSDSFRTLFEAVLEDYIIGGYGCIEPRMTPMFKRPFKLFGVLGSSIRIFPDWAESTPDRPRYAQMTGLKGERGIVAFLDKELIYIKQNNRNSTPFGLGCLESAFNVVNFHLGALDAAGRAGSDQIHKTMLWWAPAQTSSNMFAVRKHIQNELEGQAKIGLISGMQKPEVVDINAVKMEDLLLEWQIFLIKVIAQAFDISPIALGIDQHSNRSTSQTMSDQDWRSGVVPRARAFEETISFEILHKFMGWTDLEFAWIGLEDPDALTKVSIQQRYYMMNVYTPDDVRKDLGMPPLPAGWGRLTSGQLSLLVMQAQAKLGIKGGGSSSGVGSMGTNTGAGSTTGGGGFGSSGTGGTGTIGAAGWTANDIAMMSPDDIQQFQDAGLLPPTDELGQQMEEQQPGILETLSFELRDFFDIQEQLEDEAEIQPDEPTSADEKGQQRRYALSQHEPTWRERVIWDRKSGDKLPDYKQKEPEPGRVTLDYSPRGKYPRSGGNSSKKKGAKNLYK